MTAIKRPNASHELDFTLSRTFDAAPERVFAAWTDPAMLAVWYGPRQFRKTCTIDLRVGGKLCICMHAPKGGPVAGGDYPINGVYREIVEFEKLVWVQDCDEHPQTWHDSVNRYRTAEGNLGKTMVTVLFENVSGKTAMTVSMHFVSQEDRDALVKLGMGESWEQSLDKMSELLQASAGCGGSNH